MKTLYLIRHAKSSWENPRLADFDRPLNHRGKHDAPEMGRRIAARKILPDLMVSSPALRARETSLKLALEIRYPEAKIAYRPSIYLAAVPELLKEIGAFPKEASTVFLIGHNPGITDLAEYLTESSLGNIPTCGVACIDLEGNAWDLAGRGTGNLLYLDCPKEPFRL